MWAEWAEGQDIGQAEVLKALAMPAGLDAGVVDAALDNDSFKLRLQDNWAEATELGVIGVPTFVVDDQIFWGNDRVDFLLEHLDALGLKKT